MHPQAVSIDAIEALWPLSPQVHQNGKVQHCRSVPETTWCCRCQLCWNLLCPLNLYVQRIHGSKQAKYSPWKCARVCRVNCKLYMHCACSCWKNSSGICSERTSSKSSKLKLKRRSNRSSLPSSVSLHSCHHLSLPTTSAMCGGCWGGCRGAGVIPPVPLNLKAILARRCKEDGCGLHCWFGRGELYVCLWFVSNIIAGFGVVWDNHLTRGSLQSSAAMMKRPPQLKYVEMIIKDNNMMTKCCQTNFSMGSMKQKFKQREGYAKSVAQADTVAKRKSLTNTAHGCHCREQRLCRDNQRDLKAWHQPKQTNIVNLSHDDPLRSLRINVSKESCERNRQQTVARGLTPFVPWCSLPHLPHCTKHIYIYIYLL